MEKRKRTIIDQTFPMVAVVLSIISILWFAYEFTNFSSNYLEILLATSASMIGIVISFFVLKLLKLKIRGNIFISYSHKDKKFIEKLVQYLKVKRFNIIYDDEVIKVGDNIKDTILKNIDNCDLIIIALSENAKVENFLGVELKYALEKNKKILPILLDNKVQIPKELTNIKYADFSMEYENSMNLLVRSLMKALEEKSSS
jgi:hypothetical protein